MDGFDLRRGGERCVEHGDMEHDGIAGFVLRPHVELGAAGLFGAA